MRHSRWKFFYFIKTSFKQLNNLSHSSTRFYRKAILNIRVWIISPVAHKLTIPVETIDNNNWTDRLVSAYSDFSYLWPYSAAKVHNQVRDCRSSEHVDHALLFDVVPRHLIWNSFNVTYTNTIISKNITFLK